MAHTRTDEQQFHSDFSKNVTSLEAAKKKVNTQINDSLRRDDDFSLKAYTNLYLLIYCAWTEALLVKIIHTPFGFTIDEKEKILKDKNVINRWKKCVDIAFSKMRKKGSEIPNKKKKIYKLLEDYLKNQARIRNKIAHGQWEYPLQKNNIKPDIEAQILIGLIDVMQINMWFEIFKEIAEIVRGLIDARSINNHLAHYNHYFVKLTNIQELIEERKSWTLKDKKARLKLKPRSKVYIQNI